MLLPLVMDAFPEEGCDDTRPCMPLSPVLEMPPEFPDEDANLLPCSICNRTFNPASLQRHEKVCEKLQTKKRKAFDSTKQRQEGLDPTGSILRDPKNTPPPPKVKSRWREKHKEFLKTIRAAKSTSDDENDDQRSVPSDYIKCPNCERHFGPKSADRHISWCSEQKTRLPRNHTNEDVEAVQRLKTRTKYTPPKPGHSGWRAPKRKDVISSIPPPNVGANITPPGRLISPPPPAHSNRHFSPPPAHPPPHRNWSPPFVSSTRRNTLSSLPPGPPKYGGTSSLGRSAGKQFQAMMQSMAGSGYNSNNGLSTGGGSIHSIYGSTSGSSTPNYGGQHNYFNRSASLKLPRRRPAGGTRMARHRDLAMDMLASVSVDGSKREEPEGDESHDMSRSRENFSYKLEDKSYDPYSAAELQFQDLLGPSKSGVGLRAGMMLGSTISLQSLNYNKLHSLERDFSPPKRNSLRGLGSLSLCSLGLDTLDITSHDLKSPGDDSSELESLGDSSQGMHSPDNEIDELLASPSNEHPPSSQAFKSGKFNEKDDSINNSINNSRSRTVSSQSIRLPFDENRHSDRKVPDGSYSFSKSPSPSFNFDSFRRSISKERTSPSKSPPSYNLESFRRSASKEQTPPPKPSIYNFDSFRSTSKEQTPPPKSPPFTFDSIRRSFSKEQTPPPKSPQFTFDSIRRSFSKERTPPIKSPSPYNYESDRRSVSNERTSPPYQPSLGPTSDFKKSESPSTVNSNTNSYGWTAASDHVGSPQSYSRYFGSKPPPEVNGCNKTSPNYSTTSYESLKALRASLDDDNKSQKTMMHRLDESIQRVSSGSSTDSSLPPLSSPVPSSSILRTQSLNPSSGGSYAMPKFCYECGNKYPIMQARFCCQCGAPRVTNND